MKVNQFCLAMISLSHDTTSLCGSRKNPYPAHRRSLEIPRGRGVLKAKFVKEMYENVLEFPGGRGGAKQKIFHGGSMDIFWNCTLSSSDKVTLLLH